MERGRRGRGRGRGRGQWVPVDQGLDRESAAEQQGGPQEQGVPPGQGGGDQVATAINRMTDILEHLAGPQGQGQGPPAGHERGEDRALERFQRFGPPTFYGNADPEVAEMWMERISDIFAALDYTEGRQVSFASFQFEGPARAWWHMVQAKWEDEMVPRTWANFVREFTAKYLPPIIQERREEAFIRCRQGNQTVAEYETQFTRLARHAPEMVATEQRRIRKFFHGLNVELQEGLATTRIETFGDVIEMAQRLESAKALVKNVQAKRKGGHGTGSDPGEQSTPPVKFGRGIGEEGIPQEASAQEELAEGSQVSGAPGEKGSSGRTSQERQLVRHCGYCGKAGHTAETCWKKARKCFKCGSAEHRIADCPIRIEEEGVGGPE